MNNHETANRENLDHLFEIGLVLVTVLSAAELQFAASILPADEHNVLNFFFRITTFPIIILVLLWLFKELYPSRLERKVPLRRGLKEFSWVFLGNLIVLNLVIYLILSFSGTLTEFALWAEILAVCAIVFTFPVTWAYRKCDVAPETESLPRKFYYLTVLEHAVCSVVAYFLVEWMLEVMAATPL